MAVDAEARKLPMPFHNKISSQKAQQTPEKKAQRSYKKDLLAFK